MAHIVTIINFKGGVGKTTCSVEIAAALARHYGRRTLLVDLDPQASATFYVMKQERWKEWTRAHGSTYELFNQKDGHFSIHDAIVHVLCQVTRPFRHSSLPGAMNSGNFVRENRFSARFTQGDRGRSCCVE